MKARFLTAMAIGVLISTVLLAMERVTDHSVAWMAWQMPGISAAYLFWGAVGDSVFLGVAIAWFVNAVVYGAAAFAVLIFLKLLTMAQARGEGGIGQRGAATGRHHQSLPSGNRRR